MFIALRDIRFAKGRFALITSVIVLMTFMVVALSALTNGLAAQSISAVERLPGQQIILQEGTGGSGPTLSQSSLDQSALSRIGDIHGEQAAQLGVTTTRITRGDTTATVSLFGADQRLMPKADTGAFPANNGVLLNQDQADDLGVRVGETVSIGGAQLTVDGIGDAGSFAHTPVAYTTMSTWQNLSHGEQASAVVVLNGNGDTVAGTTAIPMKSVTDVVPGYGSEHGSLLAIQLMLLAISALVVGAFFAVWTVQRTRDLAVLRALGASRGYLLGDGLGQAAIILLIGEFVGAALGIGLTLALSATGAGIPLALSASGIALPVIGMTVLGIAGAALAVRRVTVVDPSVALSR